MIFGTLPTADQLQKFKDYLLNFKMGPVDLQYETPNILNALQIEVLKLYAKDPSADTDDLGRTNDERIKNSCEYSTFHFFICP